MVRVCARARTQLRSLLSMNDRISRKNGGALPIVVDDVDALSREARRHASSSFVCRKHASPQHLTSGPPSPCRIAHKAGRDRKGGNQKVPSVMQARHRLIRHASSAGHTTKGPRGAKQI